MAYLNWNDSYSLKIESIDRQHKKLFDLLNDFYDNIKNRTNTEIIYNLLKGMKDYTILHMKYETDLLRKYEYEKLDAHIQEHKVFLKKIEDLENRQKRGIALVSYEITDFLKKWIKEHILVGDKEIAAFLIKNGVK